MVHSITSSISIRDGGHRLSHPFTECFSNLRADKSIYFIQFAQFFCKDIAYFQKNL